MKKAQISSAVALAFALGIVVPVAGIVNTNGAVYAAADAKQTRDINTAINSFKKSFKTIKTYAAVDATPTELTGTAAYDYYGKAGLGTPASTKAAEIKTMVDFMDKLNEENGAVSKEVAQEVEVELGAYAAVEEIDEIITSNKNWKNASLSTIQGKVRREIIPALRTQKGAVDDDEAKTIDRIINKIEKIIDKNGIKDAEKIVATTAVTAGALKDVAVKAYYVELTGKDIPDGVEDMADLKTMVDAIRAAAPQYKLYIDTLDEIEELVDLRDNQDPTDGEVEDAIKDLKKAAGSSTTPSDDEKPSDEDKKPTDEDKTPAGPTDEDKKPAAPDTGVLLNDENGATAISVVAGLATALTALGAGVVAYRNARRSSRK